MIKGIKRRRGVEGREGVVAGEERSEEEGRVRRNGSFGKGFES